MPRSSITRSRRRSDFLSTRGPLRSPPISRRYSKGALPPERKQAVKQVMLNSSPPKVSEVLPLKPMALPEFQGPVVRTALTKARIIKSEKPLSEESLEQERAKNLRKIIFPKKGSMESARLIRAVDSAARNLTDAFFQAKRQFFLFENRHLSNLSSHGVNLNNLRNRLTELTREKALLSWEIDRAFRSSSLSRRIPILRMRLARIGKALNGIDSYLMERDALTEAVKDSFLKRGRYFSELLGVKVDELVSLAEGHARQFRTSESKQIRTPDESSLVYGLILTNLKEVLQRRRQELLVEQRRRSNIISLEEKRKAG